jgi:hypothetical protein
MILHPTITCIAAAAMFTLAASAAFAQSGLPNPALTPGAVNDTSMGTPVVTQDNIDQTICVSGYTQTIRPSASYTTMLKRQQIRQYGYLDRKLRDYEEDHLIPLALNGHPTAEENLWPEPRNPNDGWTVAKKDQLEVTLQKLVCAHLVPLEEAQQAIAKNWTAVYDKYEAMWRNRQIAK